MPSYRFTGYARTGYMAYRDLGTGAMLVAEPGGTYQIAGVTFDDPVPPRDGRWAPADPAAAPPPVPDIPVPAVTLPAAAVATDGPPADGPAPPEDPAPAE